MSDASASIDLDFSLKGKRALVTGGASGIGAAICSAFAAKGARVAVVDLNVAAAQANAKVIGGGNVEIDDGDARPLGGKGAADRRANAGSAASDERALAFQGEIEIDGCECAGHLRASFGTLGGQAYAPGEGEARMPCFGASAPLLTTHFDRAASSVSTFAVVTGVHGTL